jgi:Flp pilus assembly protein TadG
VTNGRRTDGGKRGWPGHPRRGRRGATLVEAAIAITVFMTLVFCMLNLGILMFRKHVVTEAARQGARSAIVHGYLASNNPAINVWGPTPPYLPALTSGSLYSGSTSYTVQADDASDDLAATIRPYLVGLDPSTVTIQIQWPDGDNALGSRVTVSVTAADPDLMPFNLSGASITLGASSTMTISH